MHEDEQLDRLESQAKRFVEANGHVPPDESRMRYATDALTVCAEVRQLRRQLEDRPVAELDPNATHAEKAMTALLSAYLLPCVDPTLLTGMALRCTQAIGHALLAVHDRLAALQEIGTALENLEPSIYVDTQGGPLPDAVDRLCMAIDRLEVRAR